MQFALATSLPIPTESRCDALQRHVMPVIHVTYREHPCGRCQPHAVLVDLHHEGVENAGGAVAQVKVVHHLTVLALQLATDLETLTGSCGQQHRQGRPVSKETEAELEIVGKKVRASTTVYNVHPCARMNAC